MKINSLRLHAALVRIDRCIRRPFEAETAALFVLAKSGEAPREVALSVHTASDQSA